MGKLAKRAKVVEIDKRGDLTQITFNTGTTAGELREALASVPQGEQIKALGVLYFSHNDECEGQVTPDEDHHLFGASFILTPAQKQWVPGKVA